MNDHVRRIEDGEWFYFTVDLDFEGFAIFTFLRYVRTNDRTSALVRFKEQKYFPTRDLLLVPYNTEPHYFRATDKDILSVWTLNGSSLEFAETFDAKAGWPRNILDKAAVTPSRDTAARWTMRSNPSLQREPAASGRPLS